MPEQMRQMVGQDQIAQQYYPVPRGNGDYYNALMVGTPTDAEIAAAYNGDKARWAARETRTVSLVTVLDQNAANALATKIRGGTPVADAARAAGLEEYWQEALHSLADARHVVDIRNLGLVAGVDRLAPRGDLGAVVLLAEGVAGQPGECEI